MDNQAKYIWVGSVGVKIEPRSSNETGNRFYPFELVRCFRRGDSEKMEYANTFTERNLGQLGYVMQEAIKYMEDNPLRALAA